MLKSQYRCQIRRVPLTRALAVTTCILMFLAFAACLVGCDRTGSLIGKFKDKKAEVRENAMKELVAIGGPAVDDLLASLKEDNDKDKTMFEVSLFKSRIIETLGEIKDPRAIEPLVSVITGDYYSNSEREDTFSREALVSIGKKSSESLMPLLKTNTVAVEAVGRLKDPAAVGPLIEALKAGLTVKGASPSELTDHVTAVRSALVSIGAPSVEPLIAALQGDASIRDSADNILIRIGAPAVGSLANLLGCPDADVQKRAACAMMRIGPTPAAPYTAALAPVIAAHHAYFIKEGINGSEHFLAAALHASNNMTMATDFLNCGNETLEGEATNWGTSRGYSVVKTGESPGGPTWGQK